jgi:hypothetical protein
MDDATTCLISAIDAGNFIALDSGEEQEDAWRRAGVDLGFICFYF